MGEWVVGCVRACVRACGCGARANGRSCRGASCGPCKAWVIADPHRWQAHLLLPFDTILRDPSSRLTCCCRDCGCGVGRWWGWGWGWGGGAQTHAAAGQLLACHLVHEALAVYRRAGLLRDAVAVARLRLGPDDPATRRLWHDWGLHMEVAAGRVCGWLWLDGGRGGRGLGGAGDAQRSALTSAAGRYPAAAVPRGAGMPRAAAWGPWLRGCLCRGVTAAGCTQMAPCRGCCRRPPAPWARDRPGGRGPMRGKGHPRRK